MFRNTLKSRIGIASQRAVVGREGDDKEPEWPGGERWSHIRASSVRANTSKIFAEGFESAVEPYWRRRNRQSHADTSVSVRASKEQFAERWKGYDEPEWANCRGYSHDSSYSMTARSPEIAECIENCENIERIKKLIKKEVGKKSYVDGSSATARNLGFGKKTRADMPEIIYNRGQSFFSVHSSNFRASDFTVAERLKDNDEVKNSNWTRKRRVRFSSLVTISKHDVAVAERLCDDNEFELYKRRNRSNAEDDDEPGRSTKKQSDSEFYSLMTASRHNVVEKREDIDESIRARVKNQSQVSAHSTDRINDQKYLYGSDHSSGKVSEIDIAEGPENHGNPVSIKMDPDAKTIPSVNISDSEIYENYEDNSEREDGERHSHATNHSLGKINNHKIDQNPKSNAESGNDVLFSFAESYSSVKVSKHQNYEISEYYDVSVNDQRYSLVSSSSTKARGHKTNEIFEEHDAAVNDMKHSDSGNLSSMKISSHESAENFEDDLELDNSNILIHAESNSSGKNIEYEFHENHKDGEPELRKTHSIVWSDSSVKVCKHEINENLKDEYNSEQGKIQPDAHPGSSDQFGALSYKNPEDDDELVNDKKFSYAKTYSSVKVGTHEIDKNLENDQESDEDEKNYVKDHPSGKARGNERDELSEDESVKYTANSDARMPFSMEVSNHKVNESVEDDDKPADDERLFHAQNHSSVEVIENEYELNPEDDTDSSGHKKISYTEHSYARGESSVEKTNHKINETPEAVSDNTHSHAKKFNSVKISKQDINESPKDEDQSDSDNTHPFATQPNSVKASKHEVGQNFEGNSKSVNDEKHFYGKRRSSSKISEHESDLNSEDDHGLPGNKKQLDKRRSSVKRSNYETGEHPQVEDSMSNIDTEHTYVKRHSSMQSDKHGHEENNEDANESVNDKKQSFSNRSSNMKLLGQENDTSPKGADVSESDPLKYLDDNRSSSMKINKLEDNESPEGTNTSEDGEKHINAKSRSSMKIRNRKDNKNVQGEDESEDDEKHINVESRSSMKIRNRKDNENPEPIDESEDDEKHTNVKSSSSMKIRNRKDNKNPQGEDESEDDEKHINDKSHSSRKIRKRKDNENPEGTDESEDDKKHLKAERRSSVQISKHENYENLDEEGLSGEDIHPHTTRRTSVKLGKHKTDQNSDDENEPANYKKQPNDKGRSSIKTNNKHELDQNFENAHKSFDDTKHSVERRSSIKAKKYETTENLESEDESSDDKQHPLAKRRFSVKNGRHESGKITTDEEKSPSDKRQSFAQRSSLSKTTEHEFDESSVDRQNESKRLSSNKVNIHQDNIDMTAEDDEESERRNKRKNSRDNGHSSQSTRKYDVTKNDDDDKLDTKKSKKQQYISARSSKRKVAEKHEKGDRLKNRTETHRRFRSSEMCDEVLEDSDESEGIPNQKNFLGKSSSPFRDTKHKSNESPVSDVESVRRSGQEYVLDDTCSSAESNKQGTDESLESDSDEKSKRKTDRRHSFYKSGSSLRDSKNTRCESSHSDEDSDKESKRKTDQKYFYFMSGSSLKDSKNTRCESSHSDEDSDDESDSITYKKPSHRKYSFSVKSNRYELNKRLGNHDGSKIKCKQKYAENSSSKKANRSKRLAEDEDSECESYTEGSCVIPCSPGARGRQMAERRERQHRSKESQCQVDIRSSTRNSWSQCQTDNFSLTRNSCRESQCQTDISSSSGAGKHVAGYSERLGKPKATRDVCIQSLAETSCQTEERGERTCDPCSSSSPDRCETFSRSKDHECYLSPEVRAQLCRIRMASLARKSAWEEDGASCDPDYSKPSGFSSCAGGRSSIYTACQEDRGKKRVDFDNTCKDSNYAEEVCATKEPQKDSPKKETPEMDEGDDAESVAMDDDQQFLDETFVTLQDSSSKHRRKPKFRHASLGEHATFAESIIEWAGNVTPGPRGTDAAAKELNERLRSYSINEYNPKKIMPGKKRTSIFR